MTAAIGVFRPRHLSGEVGRVDHTAGLYGIQTIPLNSLMDVRLAADIRKAEIVLLEQDTHAVPLGRFIHPERALYVVGPENGSLPREVLDLGRIVQVETASRYPLKPHVAAAIVLHDRYTQIGEAA